MRTNKTILRAVLAALCALAMVVFLAGCQSTGGKTAGTAEPAPTPLTKAIPEDFPDEVKTALLKIRDTPDVLIGIGVGRMATKMMSQSVATTRALADVARQMGVVVQTMVRNYQVTSKVDQSVVTSYQEKITVQLAKATFPHAGIVDIVFAPDGAIWVIVMFNKDEVKPGITEADAATKSDFPAMASFNIDDWFDKAFVIPIDEAFVANGR